MDRSFSQLDKIRVGVRPQPLRRIPATPRGPRLYERLRKGVHTGGPGLPPAGFVGGTTSSDEWTFYWASMRVLDPDRDPRIGPYFGGELWDYQSAELGGFTRALGSAVVDFVYKLSHPPLMVRIQTYRWHLAAPAGKQALDNAQLAALARNFDVVDVYSEDYIGDPTGEAAIVLLKETLGLIRRQNPITAGSTLLVRNPLGPR